jgi:CRISPR-associated protein Cas1
LQLDIETNQELEILEQEQQHQIAFLHQPYLVETDVTTDREIISDDGDDKHSPLQKNIWNQEMAAIYLLEQGTSIYKDHLRFIIHVSEKQKLEIPIREVEQIMIFGNIQLSTPVINACLKEKIGVLFLNQLGQYHGHLASEESTNIDNHLTQMQRRDDDYFQFQVSRAIVYGKLTNSKQL